MNKDGRDENGVEGMRMGSKRIGKGGIVRMGGKDSME